MIGPKKASDLATSRANYADAYCTLPRLERLIVRLRAAESVLALFYAQEIRHLVIDMIRTTDRWRARRGVINQRAPENGGKPFEKSLDALVQDGHLTHEMRKRIVELSDFRNDVGHRIDQLFSDLEQAGFRRLIYEPEYLKQRGMKRFDHGAVDEMKELFNFLQGVAVRGSFLTTFRLGGHLLFSSTERSLAQDIKRLRRSIGNESARREKEIERINRELFEAHNLILSLAQNGLPELRYARGRMTPRGQEICFRCFEAGISLVAICHLFKMKLPAIRKKWRDWQELGGPTRKRPNFDSL